MKQLKCNIPSQILGFTPMISMTSRIFSKKQTKKKPFLKATEIPKPKKYNFANKKAVLHQF